MSERIRWQYRIVNLGAFFTGEKLQNTLAALGADGWELAHVFDKSSNWIGGFEKGFALLKRPVMPGEPDPPEGWAVYERAQAREGSGLAKIQDDSSGWG